jgi:hypothetical protein
MLGQLLGTTKTLVELRIVHMDTGSAGPWAHDLRIDYLNIYKDAPTKKFILAVENNGGIYGGGGVDKYLSLETGSASLGDLLVTLYGPHVEAQWASVEKVRRGPEPPAYTEDIMAMRLYNIAAADSEFKLDLHIIGAAALPKAAAASPALPKSLPVSLPTFPMVATAAAPKMPVFIKTGVDAV